MIISLLPFQTHSEPNNSLLHHAYQPWTQNFLEPGLFFNVLSWSDLPHASIFCYSMQEPHKRTFLSVVFILKIYYRTHYQKVFLGYRVSVFFCSIALQMYGLNQIQMTEEHEEKHNCTCVVMDIHQTAVVTILQYMCILTHYVVPLKLI